MLKSIINRKGGGFKPREIVTSVPKRSIIKGSNFRESVIDLNNTSVETRSIQILDGLTSVLNLDNVEFIYPITLGIKNSKNYFLVQFDGKIQTPFGSIESIHPVSGINVTSVYLFSCNLENPDGYLDSGIFLWCYDGVEKIINMEKCNS